MADAKTTIYMQKHNGRWLPHFDADILETKNYSENQVVEFKPKKIGAKKMRSLTQLALYWVLIGIVFDNTILFDSREQLSEYVKLKMKYIESIIYIDGKEHIITGSLAIDKMDHAKFCAFFDEAKPFMADMLGIIEEKLLNNRDAAI